MNKEEKIKEAYGEYWDKMKLWINIDGWFNKNAFFNKNFFFKYDDLNLFFYHKEDFMIPISLKGIENNNGWIKIESENDLPDNIEGLWEVVRNGEQIFIELLKDNKQRLYKDFLKDGITHYKIKEKSQPPIY